jgi:hypothetical protein
MMGQPGAGIALCAVAVLAIIVAGVGLSGAAREQASPASRVANSAEPTRQAPTRRDAVAAATDFLVALDLETLLDDSRRRRVINAVAAPHARASLQHLYKRERDRVAKSYRRRPRFARAALLGYRVDGFTGSQATVSIWAATIGGSGSFAPATGWSTTTVTLSWSDTGWRISGVDETPGPSARWPTASLASEGRTFTEYRHAP